MIRELGLPKIIPIFLFIFIQKCTFRSLQLSKHANNELNRSGIADMEIQVLKMKHFFFLHVQQLKKI